MSKDNEPISIRLSDIIRFIRKYFLFFLIVGVVSAIGGYMASYLRQNKYTASARLLPEQNPSATGSLSELVTLAGIAARNRTEALRPDLYPDILSSNQFALRLLTTPLKDQEGEKVTLFDFFQANSEVEDKVPAFKKEQIDGTESPLLLDRSQQILIDRARSCVSASYGKIDGVISVSVELRDPVLAAEIVQYSINYLTEFVTSYRLDKAIAKVNLLEQQSERAGSEYRNALSQLSGFRDRNRNLFTYSSRTDEIRLEGDVLRTQNIYNDLTQKLELARVQKEEETPVIKMIDVPIVPYKTSSPRRLVMAFFTMVIFSLAALGYVLFFREKVQRVLL